MTSPPPYFAFDLADAGCVWFCLLEALPMRSTPEIQISPAKVGSTFNKLDFLSGGGEMGERIRAFDWGKTPLGSPEEWPQSLKAAVSICLRSRMPIVIWWDKDQSIQLYNDAYISFLGPSKHPAFLGRSGRECWREIWDTMGPLWDKVFGTGEATWSEDFLYVFNRRLPREEGYFTFSYSPILGATGTADGLFCACYETTEKIVGARRGFTR